jgi:hypothetical protein
MKRNKVLRPLNEQLGFGNNKMGSRERIFFSLDKQKAKTKIDHPN